MQTVMPSSFADVDHLLRRAGFGGHPDEISSLMAHDWPQVVDQVMDVSGAVPAHVGVPNLDPNLGWWDRYVAMTWFWLERARATTAPLVEKMVLFWHGHLCSSLEKVGDHQALFNQNQLFRTNGLGSVPELMHGISVQPAMLRYLDNDRNKAGDPNENFARELMELFTLGVGHYSEDDVKASARAWTGHGLDDDKTAYVFHPDRHDYGTKTFMGVTQNWDGPDIINHLFFGPTQRTAARFIAAKMWAFFAYPDPEPALVEDLATAFISGGLRADALARAIFLRPEFRSSRARTGLVRTPVDFTVAAMRRTGFPCSEAHPEWSLPAMGQKPYAPPNVAGWKQNEYWISPSAMWAKRKFAGHLRWKGYNGGLLANSEALSPTDAVEAALMQFGIYNASQATRNNLRTFVESERAARGWAERAGLLLLTPLTPEFQLA